MQKVFSVWLTASLIVLLRRTGHVTKNAKGGKGTKKNMKGSLTTYTLISQITRMFLSLIKYFLTIWLQRWYQRLLLKINT